MLFYAELQRHDENNRKKYEREVEENNKKHKNSNSN